MALSGPTPMLDTPTPTPTDLVVPITNTPIQDPDTPTPTPTLDATSRTATATFGAGATPTATPTPPGGQTPTPTPLPLDVCAIVAGPFVSRSESSAFVAWSTNFDSDAAVLALGSPSFDPVADPQLQADHRLEVTDLAAQAEYDFEVRSQCGGIAEGVARRGSFTARSSGPPEIVEGPFVPLFGLGPGRAVVVWTTESPADAKVEYGLTSNYGQTLTRTTLAEEHLVTLTGLVPGMLYHYRVTSCDAFDPIVNCVHSADQTFEATPFTGGSAPVLTEGPSVDSFDVSDRQALVRWTTDEPASSAVRYGPPGNPALLVQSFNSALEPRLVLPDLQPGADYCYQVEATDADSNSVVSDPQCFTTDLQPDADPPLLLEAVAGRAGDEKDRSAARGAGAGLVEVTYVTEDRVILEWQTDEPATAELFLSPAAARGTGGEMWISSALRRRFHANVRIRALRGARAGSYAYRLRLTDMEGNTSTFASPPGELIRLEKDMSPPVIQSPIEAVYAGADRVIVRWTTDEASTSAARIQVGGSETGYRVFDPAPVRRHQVELTRLDVFQGPFDVLIESCNPEQLCVQGAVATQLQPRDDDPPAFQGPAQVVQRGADRALFLWATDEPATSVVRYRERIPRQTGWTRIDSRKVTQHRVLVTRLRPGVCYEATVASVDPAGNSVQFPQTLDLCTGTVDSSSRAVAGASALALAGAGIALLRRRR
jgi:hypothetical protein